MQKEPDSMLTTYANELLRLVYAEEQAAFYIEGFTVLASSAPILSELKYLQNETNLHLSRVVAMFHSADPDVIHDASDLESRVKSELAAYVNVGSLDTSSEQALICATIRLEHYLLHQYRKLATIAGAVGRDREAFGLEAIYASKETRLEALRDQLAPSVDLRNEPSEREDSVRNPGSGVESAAPNPTGLA